MTIDRIGGTTLEKPSERRMLSSTYRGLVFMVLAFVAFFYIVFIIWRRREPSGGHGDAVPEGDLNSRKESTEGIERRNSGPGRRGRRRKQGHRGDDSGKGERAGRGEMTGKGEMT